jgi:hypothetical protein
MAHLCSPCDSTFDIDRPEQRQVAVPSCPSYITKSVCKRAWTGTVRHIDPPRGKLGIFMLHSQKRRKDSTKMSTNHIYLLSLPKSRNLQSCDGVTPCLVASAHSSRRRLDPIHTSCVFSSFLLAQRRSGRTAAARRRPRRALVVIVVRRTETNESPPEPWLPCRMPSRGLLLFVPSFSPNAT